MFFHKPFLFWFGLFIIAASLFWSVSAALTPFIIGGVLAFLLNPLVNWMQGKGVGRITAVCVIMLGVVLLLVSFFVICVPLISGQLVDLGANLPSYVREVQAILSQRLHQLFPNAESMDRFMTTSFDLIKNQVAEIGPKAVRHIFASSLTSINIISLIVFTPIITFYLLLDWNAMVVKVQSWIPLRHKETVTEILVNMDRVLSGYVRGQSIVCFILGATYSIGLSMIGLNFGIAIGCLAGFFSFIPFVGTVGGFVIAITVAMVQFLPSYMPIVAVAMVFVFGNVIEGNFLSPKIVGGSVNLHPVVMMLGLSVFGYLMGFIGLLIAIPVTALLGVIVRFSLDRYLKSSLYTDHP